LSILKNIALFVTLAIPVVSLRASLGNFGMLHYVLDEV
jgi:hypothetical protein